MGNGDDGVICTYCGDRVQNLTLHAQTCVIPGSPDDTIPTPISAASVSRYVELENRIEMLEREMRDLESRVIDLEDLEREMRDLESRVIDLED